MKILITILMAFNLATLTACAAAIKQTIYTTSEQAAVDAHVQSLVVNPTNGITTAQAQAIAVNVIRTNLLPGVVTNNAGVVPNALSYTNDANSFQGSVYLANSVGGIFRKSTGAYIIKPGGDFVMAQGDFLGQTLISPSGGYKWNNGNPFASILGELTFANGALFASSNGVVYGNGVGLTNYPPVWSYPSGTFSGLTFHLSTNLTLLSGTNIYFTAFDNVNIASVGETYGQMTLVATNANILITNPPSWNSRGVTSRTLTNGQTAAITLYTNAVSTNFIYVNLSVP